MKNERPLVSICMTCYNQKKFVGEALEAVLAQTYQNLEIVISDNCSSDGTSEIVQSMLEQYRKTGGSHKVIYNRNSENIGGSPNIHKCYKLSHGELIIPAHDDDVSDIHRVEKIVDAWLKSGKAATIIESYVEKIDTNGKSLGVTKEYGPHWPLCALDALRRDVIENDIFSPMPEQAVEDWIYTNRAQLIGGKKAYICIPEPLLKYRLGAGVSSKKSRFQVEYFQLMKGMMRSYDQCLEDVDVVCPLFDKDVVTELKEFSKKSAAKFHAFVRMVEDDSLKERWRAFKICCFDQLLCTGNLAYFLCVLPKFIGRPLLEMYWHVRCAYHAH